MHNNYYPLPSEGNSALSSDLKIKSEIKSSVSHFPTFSNNITSISSPISIKTEPNINNFLLAHLDAAKAGSGIIKDSLEFTFPNPSIPPIPSHNIPQPSPLLNPEYFPVTGTAPQYTSTLQTTNAYNYQKSFANENDSMKIEIDEKLCLPHEIQEEVFHIIKKTFSDVPEITQEDVEKALRLAISENIPNMRSTKVVMEKFYPDLKDKLDKKYKNINEIMKTTYTLMLNYVPESDRLKCSTEDFLVRYPEFVNESEDELKYLLQFRNFMKLALELIPPNQNKGILMAIASRLEGSGKDYVTGGGQKLETQNRVLIYENEGQVRVAKRPNRIKRKGEDLPLPIPTKPTSKVDDIKGDYADRQIPFGPIGTFDCDSDVLNTLLSLKTGFFLLPNKDEKKADIVNEKTTSETQNLIKSEQ